MRDIEKRIKLLEEYLFSEKAFNKDNTETNAKQVWSFLMQNGPSSIADIKNSFEPSKRASIQSLIQRATNQNTFFTKNSDGLFVAVPDYNWDDIGKIDLGDTSDLFEDPEPKRISAKDDTNNAEWTNEEFLNRRFDEFNELFFDNRITKIPVALKSGRSSTVGFCRQMAYQSSDRIVNHDIVIYKKVFKSRYFIENTLLHEMCHAYQVEILLNGKLSSYKADCKQSHGTSGHGPKFFAAALKVNNSKNNIEGYNITQYSSHDEFTNQPFKNATGGIEMYIYTGIECPVLILKPLSNKDINSGVFRQGNVYKYKDGAVKSAIVDMVGRHARQTDISATNNTLKKFINFIKDGSLIPYKVRPNQNLLVLYNDKESTSMKVMLASFQKPKSKLYSYYKFTGDLSVLSDFPYSTIETSCHSDAQLKSIQSLVKAGMLTRVNANENYEVVNEADNLKDDYEDVLDELDSMPNIDVVELGTKTFIITR